MIVFDTDIFSLMQRAEKDKFPALINRVCQVRPDDVKISIGSFEEQTRGWLSYLAKAKISKDQIRAYMELADILKDFSEIDVLPYDSEADFHFDRLRRAKIRIGTLDLRIASIVISRSATLISRNLCDFSKVPGLKVEDWTKE